MDDLDDLLDCEQDLLDESFADQGVLLCSDIIEFVCRVLAQLIGDRIVAFKRCANLYQPSAPLQILPVNAKGQMWALMILMMKSFWRWQQLRCKSLQATRVLLPQLQCSQRFSKLVK